MWAVLGAAAGTDTSETLQALGLGALAETRDIRVRVVRQSLAEEGEVRAQVREGLGDRD